MIIILLLSLVLCAILYDYYMHHKRNGRLIDLIPGAPHIPIFGSAHLVFRKSQKDIWNLIRYYTNTLYPIAKCWSGPLPVVSIRHPDDLEKVLSNVKHIEKNLIMYYLLRPWLNDGLLTSGGNKWHTRRKLLTPAFHFNILRQFSNVLFEESSRMIQSLKNEKGPLIKDLVPFLSEHTLNIISETSMGTSLHSLGATKERYRETVEELGRLIIYRLMSPWFYPDFLFALSPAARKQAKLLKILHDFTEKVITERKLYHESTNGRYLKTIDSSISVGIDDAEVVGSQKKRLALLDLLIAASRENNLTDLDIREEVDTFMFEGHDTTAMGLCFTLLLLAEHKDIQVVLDGYPRKRVQHMWTNNRIRTEVDGVMTENEGKLTMASLQKLSYLESCLKEALRLYPTVHAIFRIISEDIKCQSYTVPSNTLMYLNIYGVHRDPNFWPNPDVFDPDRFLPDRAQNRHPYSYIPFSAGPRNCIGQRFALLEMKAIVASLVHNFYLEPVDYLKDVQIKLDLILRPDHPVHIKFVPIK